jgi:hypothetical protein
VQSGKRLRGDAGPKITCTAASNKSSSLSVALTIEPKILATNPPPVQNQKHILASKLLDLISGVYPASTEHYADTGWPIYWARCRCS